jgi:hypothetical protein
MTSLESPAVSSLPDTTLPISHTPARTEAAPASLDTSLQPPLVQSQHFSHFEGSTRDSLLVDPRIHSAAPPGPFSLLTSVPKKLESLTPSLIDVDDILQNWRANRTLAAQLDLRPQHPSSRSSDTCSSGLECKTAELPITGLITKTTLPSRDNAGMLWSMEKTTVNFLFCHFFWALQSKRSILSDSEPGFSVPSDKITNYKLTLTQALKIYVFRWFVHLSVRKPVKFLLFSRLGLSLDDAWLSYPSSRQTLFPSATAVCAPEPVSSAQSQIGLSVNAPCNDSAFTESRRWRSLASAEHPTPTQSPASVPVLIVDSPKVISMAESSRKNNRLEHEMSATVAQLQGEVSRLSRTVSLLSDSGGWKDSKDSSAAEVRGAGLSNRPGSGSIPSAVQSSGSKNISKKSLDKAEPEKKHDLACSSNRPTSFSSAPASGSSSKAEVALNSRVITQVTRLRIF